MYYFNYFKAESRFLSAHFPQRLKVECNQKVTVFGHLNENDHRRRFGGITLWTFAWANLLPFFVFTETQWTPAHWNQGGARGERHSAGQRFVHSGEHRPWMLLADQLGGGRFVFVCSMGPKGSAGQCLWVLTLSSVWKQVMTPPLFVLRKHLGW